MLEKKTRTGNDFDRDLKGDESIRHSSRKSLCDTQTREHDAEIQGKEGSEMVWGWKGGTPGRIGRKGVGGTKLIRCAL